MRQPLGGLKNLMHRLKLNSLTELLSEKTDAENITKLMKLIKRHRVKDEFYYYIEGVIGLLGTL